MKKECELCGVEITPPNWSRHLRSKTHIKNDPEQTIPMKRSGWPRVPKEPQLHRVLKLHKPIFSKPKIRLAVRKKEPGFRSRLSTLEIENTQNYKDIRRFLNIIKRTIIGNIRK